MSPTTPGLLRLRRVFRVAALSLTVLLLGLIGAQAAGAASIAGQSRAAAATAPQVTSAGAGAFHQTKTITRTNLINGQNVVVDKRTVSLSVNVTNNLFEQQVIDVSWSGAHPTGGITPNPNDSVLAPYQEYPMVLLECHGKPAQITPETCWTTTPSERFFSGSPAQPFPPWRLDRYATAAGQRNLTENQPDPLPKGCGLIPGPHFWLPYVNPEGQSWPIGPGGCAGMPDEMDLTGGLGVFPSNETFAATGLDGRGTDSFDVWTGELNEDLGCSQQVPCALVAIPIMGISCDPAGTGMPPDDQPTPAQEPAAAAQCEQTGFFAPGEQNNQGDTSDPQIAVTGQLWWAASNWRNRFVVPLHFAPPAGICAIVNKQNHLIEVYGSELVDQAATQWQPHFCLNKKLFTVDYTSESEPEAVGDLQSGQIEAALVSNQPAQGFGRPVAYAPIAASGFAISFVIDNAKGLPVTTLRLDPRLLAKLLTESYPGVNDVADGDPEILHPCVGADPLPVAGTGKCTNPLNITLDPEFQALNPGITHGVGASAAASVLLALDTDSDVMWALTSYINSNPAARAWLNGKPDPWGMTVNSAYKGIKLPVSNWPLRSTYEPPSWLAGGSGDGPGLCFELNPSPVLPLIADPQPFLAYIATDIQFYLAQPELTCTGNPSIPESEALTALGQQQVGNRFMIGVTTLADAERFGLHTASLLSYTKPGTPAEFTSAAGMTFVGPTDAGMRAAASLLIPDTKGYDWTYPYSLYGKDSAKAEQAYPGTMLVYADVPTSKLPTADATDYAKFIEYVAGPGQTPGGGTGQLAQGYLPLTAANHLGAEANYAQAAAAAISAQQGKIPALLGTSGSAPSPSPSSSTGTGTGTGTGSGSGPTPSSSGTPAPTRSVAATNVSLTPAANFGIIGYVLPVVAGLALAAAVGAVLVSRLARVRGKRW